MAAHPPRASRPLPSVIQPPDHQLDPHARLSYSSASCSSNHASGESWFQLSHSMASSQSSHACPPPLPKGARPPSPPHILSQLKPSLSGAFDSHPLDHPQPETTHSKARSISNSWKLEWRGISKIVKWAVLGEKPSKSPTAKKHSAKISHSAAQSHHSPRAHGSQSRSPVTMNAIPRPLPKDSLPNVEPAYLLNSCASSSLDLPHDNPRYPDIHSRSDVPHGSNIRSNVPISTPHSASLPASPSRNRHGSTSGRPASVHHVSKHEYSSNVHTEQAYACSELGHGDLDESHSTRYAVSDIGHSYHPSQFDVPPPLPSFPDRVRYTRSEIGHGTESITLPGARSAMASSSILVGLERPLTMYSETGVASTNAYRALQSAIALSVSETPSYAPTAFGNRRPRKLRKNIRSPSNAGMASPSRMSVSSTTRSVPTADSKYFDTAPLSAPLQSLPKPPPRPARKLTKRPTPPLPPLPKVDGDVSLDSPPPVPPKPRSALKVNLPSPQSSGTSEEGTSGSSENTSHDGLTTSPESMTSISSVSTDSHFQRPSFLRSESNRRWTVAVADVPDDIIVEELERLRKMGMRAGEVHGIRHPPPIHMGHAASNEEELAAGRHAEMTLQREANKLKRFENGSTAIAEEGEEDEIDWIYARRAILCCREVVRTERSYQARLQDLADGNVSDTVPSLLLQYLPELLAASRLLSSLFSEDPSAVGVSNAFVEVEPALESAFVAWTGVVGEFFGGQQVQHPLQRRVRSAAIPHPIKENRVTVDELGRQVKNQTRAISLQGHGGTVFTAAVPSSTMSSPMQSRANSQLHRNTTHGSSMQWLFRPAFSPPQSTTPSTTGSSSEKESSFSFSLKKSFSRSSSKASYEKRRRPPFRELAILPTQRVTRYVLLYKDLLRHTPLSSPARELVERAVYCAQDLAQKCDKAQANAAFLYNP